MDARVNSQFNDKKLSRVAALRWLILRGGFLRYAGNSQSEGILKVGVDHLHRYIHQIKAGICTI